MQKSPTVNIIAAIGENRELGKDGNLLWHLPKDLQYFKKATKNHPVIMGRKTFESLGKPLPGRTNIVLTRKEDYQPEGVKVFNNLDDALAYAKKIEEDEIFIIGGAQVYKQTMDIADMLYLTIVKGTFDADSYFPDYSNFGKVVFEKKAVDNNYQIKFIKIKRSFTSTQDH